MKTALLIPLFFATLGTLPPGPPVERVDISQKPLVELVGAGPAKILIRSDGSKFLGVHVTYPGSGEHVQATFHDGRFGGFAVARRIGDSKVYIYDNDFDGLPEVRHVFQVSPDGSEKLIRIESLAWSSKESN